MRELAFLASRLTALYLAVRGLAQVAPLYAGFSLGLALTTLFYATLAIGLWLLAEPIAVRLAGNRSGRRPAASRDDMLQVGCGALGLVIAADGAAALLSLAPGAAALLAAGLRIALGTWLVLTALDRVPGLGWFERHIGAPAPPPRETGTGQLLRELISGAGNGGLRLGELAQSLRADAESAALRVVRSSIEAVFASVEGRHPDFSAATAADGTVTIAFSDMEGFSAMTERLGDRKAHAVIKAHNAIVRSALKAHGGQEVELQGDGFLLAFPDPLQALRCAGAIQRACAKHSARRGAEPIRVRIGLHTGKPIKEGDRFFGLTVILAARIAGQARGGETLVSSALHDVVADEGELEFGECREVELKGLAGVHRMYPVAWG